MRRAVPILIIAVIGFAVGVQAVLAGMTQTSTLRALLNANQQVPPQVVSARGAIGEFNGSLLHKASGKGTLSWHLTYNKLSSPATSAYIFFAKSGKHGQVVVGLCTKCKASTSGTTPTGVIVTKALTSRTGYVTIRTKKNPKGEISGKLRVG